MPFEGFHYESLEDAASIIIASEPTHTAEDEAYYCDSILSGEADEQEADHGDWREDTFDPDGWQGPQDRYDRWVYGE